MRSKNKWHESMIYIKNFNNENYLVLDNDFIILFDLIKKGYNSFFKPINIQEFELENNISYQNEIYKVFESKSKFSKEYLIQISNEKYSSINQFRGLQLLKIEKGEKFKSKLLIDLKDIILFFSISLSGNENNDYKKLLQELISISTEIYNYIFNSSFFDI